MDNKLFLPREFVRGDFDYFKANGAGEHAAALLALSASIRSVRKDIDHEICMGIRNGLFGTGKPQDVRESKGTK